LINDTAIWFNLDNEQLMVIDGGGLLETVCGIACVAVGSVAIIGAVVATIYCPAAISETWKLGSAGVAAVVSGAKILGY